MTLTTHHALQLSPLEQERQKVRQAGQQMHGKKLAFALTLKPAWEEFKKAHPGATRHQFFQWVGMGEFTTNDYMYLHASYALHTPEYAHFTTLETLELIGKAIQAGMTHDEIDTHLAAGTLKDVTRTQAQPDPGPRAEAHAALRQLPALRNVTAEELDTQGHAMLAALPESMLAAAQKAVESGQDFPDALANVAREYFTRLDYLTHLHTLGCCIPGCGVTGHVEAHHLLVPGYPGREAGRRSHAAYVVLCRYHHQHAPDAAHGLNSQADWSRHHFGTENAVFAVALDLYADFLELRGLMRAGKVSESETASVSDAGGPA